MYDHQGPRDGTDDWRYRASRKTCESCEYFSECVSSQTHGRQVGRNVRAEYRLWADECLSAGERKSLMARRKTKIEGSFADAANNHGFKRARWRGLAKVEIQNLLIAAIQNLRKLVRAVTTRKPSKVGSALVLERKIAVFENILQNISAKFFSWVRNIFYERVFNL